MKQGFLRAFLFGLIIWVVPFIVASAMWDPATNQPRVAIEMFTALMGFTWAITYSVVAVGYFRGLKKINRNEGWRTGIIWYLTVVILEFVFIVLIFGNAFSDFAPLILVDVPTLFVTVAIGNLLSRR